MYVIYTTINLNLVFKHQPTIISYYFGDIKMESRVITKYHSSWQLSGILSGWDGALSDTVYLGREPIQWRRGFTQAITGLSWSNTMQPSDSIPFIPQTHNQGTALNQQTPIITTRCRFLYRYGHLWCCSVLAVSASVFGICFSVFGVVIWVLLYLVWSIICVLFSHIVLYLVYSNNTIVLYLVWRMLFVSMVWGQMLCFWYVLAILLFGALN